MWWKPSSRPFSKKSKLSIVLDQVYNFIVCFYCMSELRTTIYTETKMLTSSFYLMQLVSLTHFLHEFWRKIFLIYIQLTDQISLSCYLCFLRYWTRFIVIICFPTEDVINFSFLIKPFSYITKKSGQKFKFLKNEKSV